VLTLDQAVRNAVTMGGASPAEALRMASEVPARLLGLTQKGRLIAGGDADLALFDEHLAVVATCGRGRWLFRRKSAAAAPPTRPPSHA
jgi:N-acetylglucosamine-6-phosphate deacetylase